MMRGASVEGAADGLHQIFTVGNEPLQVQAKLKMSGNEKGVSAWHFFAGGLRGVPV